MLVDIYQLGHTRLINHKNKQGRGAISDHSGSHVYLDKTPRMIRCLLKGIFHIWNGVSIFESNDTCSRGVLEPLYDIRRVVSFMLARTKLLNFLQQRKHLGDQMTGLYPLRLFM